MAEKDLMDGFLKIFESNEPTETLLVDLNLRVHPKEQKLLSKFGQNVKILTASCRYHIEKRHLLLANILKLCPNLEKMKFNFEDFGPVECFYDMFNCPIKLNNLSSFEYLPLLKSDDLDYSFSEAMNFYYFMLRQIINATGNLKHFNLSTNGVAVYLRGIEHLLKMDKTFNKLLNQVCILRLHNHVNSKNPFYHDGWAVINFLSDVSSSLESVHLCGVTWTHLSSYHVMPKLRTLSIQWDCCDRDMTLTRESLPQLNTLILCELNPTYPVYLDFGWPFINKPQETIGLQELEWEEEMKLYKFDVVDYDGENGDDDTSTYGLNWTSRSKKRKLSKGLEGPPLNVVIYLNRTNGSKGKKLWLEKVFRELSRQSMNVKSLFFDFVGLQLVGTSIRYRLMKRDCVSKCVNGEIPSLKYVVFRAIGDQPAEVHELPKFQYGFLSLFQFTPRGRSIRHFEIAKVRT